MEKLEHGTAVEVIPYPCRVKCIAYGRDVIHYDNEELRKELDDQGVDEVHRITKKVGDERINTPLLVLTIRGTSRPEYIFFGFLRCPTRPYYPSPMQCFGCWSFGHTKARCKAQNCICGNCSGTHPINEDRRCDLPKFCGRCNSDQHGISSRSCPGYKAENDVQRIKVDHGCTYPEARRILQQEKRNVGSYAEAAQRNLTPANQPTQPTPVVDDVSAILTEMRTMRKELESLRLEVQTLRIENEQLKGNRTAKAPSPRSNFSPQKHHDAHSSADIQDNI
ncbi:uncharacterized protein LOC134221717 [Armigeres subalbatus]|uniref:uncharacterized protein LOC134221717 n=1 Tax=Armigeres subalbatus TaxID=124917 RepID=UPI002ED2BB1F